MVVTSDAVEHICREKNGLSFVDILRPFGEQTDLNAPLRVSGQNIRITESRLRFSYANTMEQPTAEVIDTHLKDVVKRVSEDKLSAMPHELNKGLEPTPWFLKYRQDFLKLLCFDAHETFDHPLACVYAVASTEVDSIKAFEDLIENATLPSLMLQDYMAPVSREDCGKMFVIVHDGSREGQTGLELAREKVRLVQKEFENDTVALLLINTSGGKAELKGTPPIAFDAMRPVTVRGGGAGEHASDIQAPRDGWGSYLSKADLDRVNDLVRNFMTRCFFPKLDMCIGRLRSSVSFKRRGFTGKLMDRTTTLLKSSLSNIGRDSSPNLGFKHYSDESQMRQLGDILFLLCRYEDALEVFSAISISKEAYPKFYAGVQLMIGLCHAMLVGLTDPSVYFAKAYEYYLRIPGKTSRMLATRAAMLHSAYCLTDGQIGMAAQVLLKGYDTEEMLRGALLLEQAAILLLKTDPPSLRKFAFQMTLAGVWFYNCLFHKLSLRCYNLILDIYTNKHWDQIEQHVATMMLKFHLEQGNNADAFSWTINMLTAQHALTPDIQREYLEWICSYIKEQPSHDVTSISDFNLPVMHLDTMEVRYDGEYVSGTAHADDTDTSEWTELENRFRDPFSASVTTGLALGTMNNLEEAYGLVVCGEAVRFSCIVENPLQTPIEVTSAQLLFEFERTDSSCSPTSSPVSIPERSFALKASEKAVMQLELIPNTPGRMRIIGVSWFLNGLIAGHKLIGKVSWRDEGRCLPFRAKAHYPTLLFVALEPVPRLVLTSAPVPVRLWKGELWRNTWDIESVGTVGFRNIQITSNTPDFTFAPSNPTDEEGFYMKNSVYQLECDIAEVLQFDVCLNPQETGKQYIHTVIRYESPQTDSPLRVRFMRHTFVVEVMDALRVQSRLMSSELGQSFVLAMALENRIHDSEFDVQSISADSCQYRIQRPSSEGDIQLKVLPGQKLLQHLLVTQAELEHQTSLPNGALIEDPGSVSEDNVFIKSDAPELSGNLGLCLHWTSAERSSEISVNEDGIEDAVHHLPRQGRLRLHHDMTSLVQKLELTVDSCSMTSRFENGFGTFPVTITLHNISPETLSISFRAGEDWTLAKNVSWKQSVQHVKEEVKRAGLPPVANWVWSGQTERNVQALKPSESVQVVTEIVCFFPGSFCILDYGCKWRSNAPSTSSGVVPGKPLYLTVSEAQFVKSSVEHVHVNNSSINC